MRILRKYTNRRLYDTSRSCYVTLEDVKELVLSSEAFQVLDSKTGNDLTRNILLQIISEQEGEGHGTLLTIQVLQQLIRFYGDSMQGMMNSIADRNMAVWNMFKPGEEPAGTASSDAGTSAKDSDADKTSGK